MPLSPLLHPSPFTKSTGNHDRGRSFESVRMFRDKDDDLALFNDMSARERDNFLLPCAAEDFDGSISARLRDLSDVKLGATTTARGDASDLLDDGDKNDYDWLLTPPDTPLFPSLDDESDPPVLQERGRRRSQPINISRSNTREKNQSSRASRTSASPQRMSPSSKSSSSTSQSKHRPSSAPNSGFVRPLTPQDRPSTPPGKHGDQAPTRRLSSGSSGCGSLSRRGASPVNTNRGTSVSPKLSGWQTHLSGFSSDAPPNLRTSLADNPSSYVQWSSPASPNGRERGTSPASRNGKGTSSMYVRRSTSPTVSRGTSSPRSHDRFSPHSKGSWDRKADSLQFTPTGKYLGNTEESVTKKHESFSSPKGVAYSKRASRTISAGSAPKHSFDSAMRQMDRCKSPQRMFRPLLSSVPSSSLYVGKANTFHQHLAAVSSTVTSRSNTNSEWVVSGVPDTDGSDRVYEGGKVPSYVPKEVFSSGKGNEGINGSLPMELHAADLECFGAVLHSDATSDLMDAHVLSAGIGSDDITLGGVDEVANIYVKDGWVAGSDAFDNLVTCSECGEEFLEMEILDEKLKVCQRCFRKEEYTCSYLQPQSDQAGVVIQAKDINLEAVKQSELGLNVEDCSGRCAFSECDDASVSGPVQSGSNEERDALLLSDQEHPLVNSVEQNIQANYITESPKHGPETVPPSDYCSILDQVKDVNVYPSSRLEASEGTGISLLLVGSISSKKSLVHGKAFSTSSISYDSPSYMTNSYTSTRVMSNASCSSSVSTEAAPARETGAHFQRHSSPRKSDFESLRSEIHSDLQSQLIYASVQSCAFETEVCVTKVDVGNLEDAEGMVSEDILSLHSEECTMLEIVNLETTYFSSVELSASEHNKPNAKDETLDACSWEPSNNVELIPTVDISVELLDKTSPVAKLSNLDENTEVGEDFYPNSSENMIERGLTIPSRKSSVIMDESVPLNQLNVVDKTSMDSLDTISGVQENEHITLPRSSYSDSAGCQCDNILDQDLSTAPAEEAEATCDMPERSMLDHSPSSKDEGARKVEDLNSCLSRNTTLDEATDTILFCSSIVHDLAYKAASIAIEKKETLDIDAYRPTVTIPVKSCAVDTRTPSVPQTKRVPRLQTRKSNKQPKKIDESAFTKMEMEVFYETKIHHVTERNEEDSTKPPKLESKCNCSIM